MYRLGPTWILLSVPLLGVDNRTAVGINGDFQPLYAIISCKR